MKAIQSVQYGERVLKINRVIFAPVIIGAIIAAYFVSISKSALLIAALCGSALVFILVAGWKTGSFWYGGLFGVGIGTAVGTPIILFPNHQVEVLIQMFVSWLWVLAGMSFVLIVLKNAISRYLNNGI